MCRLRQTVFSPESERPTLLSPPPADLLLPLSILFQTSAFPVEKKKVKKGREREGSLNILKALFPFKDRPAASSAITPFVCQICLHIQYEGKKKKNLLDVA